MKITISGAIGSGKSTVSKLLAKELGFKYYSIGTIMRTMAKDRGISLHDLTGIALKDRSIDKELDRMQVKIGKEDDDFVMDSRIGFHFIPDSIKIYLEVDVKEAAKRILKEARKDEQYPGEEEAIKYITQRAESEKKRYKRYYNIDFPAKKDFDLWIDTTDENPTAVSQMIKKLIDKKR